MDEYGLAAEARFRVGIPMQLTEAMGRAVIECTAFAADDVEEALAEPEARYLLPHHRRAMIETRFAGLRGVVDRLRVETVYNVSQDAHRELRIAGFVITQHYCVEVERRIRHANFRASLGERSQLTWLARTDATSDDELWAAVVYGVSDRRPDRPSFLKIAFPRSDGRWEHTIDLSSLVPSLAAYPESPILVELRQQRRRGTA